MEKYFNLLSIMCLFLVLDIWSVFEQIIAYVLKGKHTGANERRRLYRKKKKKQQLLCSRYEYGVYLLKFFLLLLLES